MSDARFESFASAPSPLPSRLCRLCRALAFGSIRRPWLTLISPGVISLLRSAACGIWLLGAVTATSEEPPFCGPKPYLIVEAQKEGHDVPDLYLYDLSGRERQRLTGPPLIGCEAAAVSPDGAAAAFMASIRTLYVMSLDYWFLTAIHQGETSATVFSHHGKRLAYAYGFRSDPPDQRVRVERLDCPGEGQDIRFNEELSRLDFTPADDQLLATVARGDRNSVVLIDPDSGRTEAILEDDRHSYQVQAVSPFRQEVLFVSREVETGADSLMVLDWPSRASRTLRTFPRNRPVENATYSDDGRHLLFRVDQTWGMAEPNGNNILGLTTPLPAGDRPAPLGCIMPPASRLLQRLSVGQSFATYIEGEDCVALIDLKSRKVSAIKIPGARLRTVYLVE